MFVSYKFILEPTPSQVELFVQWFGAKRFVWNKALALCETRLYNGNNIPYFFEQNKMLTLWKQAKEWKFLREAPKDILQITLQDLEKGFKAMFDKKRPAMQKPRFKSKHDSHQSFKVVSSVRVENNAIKIPKIKELIKFRRSRRVKGIVKSATISFDGRKWLVSILTEVEHIKKTFERIIGIDVGVKRFVTLSDGSFVNPIDFTQDIERLAHAQVIMARREKGSARWLKAKTTVQKHMRHIADKRNDFLHKLSTQLAESKEVFIEDLNIKGMTASATGTIESPGRNVAQKRGLNRSIVQQGWGMFFDMLAYKLDRNGGKLTKARANYTSQTCSKCGHTDKESRKEQSVFKCTSCGHKINADHNAAINIRTVGLTGVVLSKGDNHVFGE